VLSWLAVRDELRRSRERATEKTPAYMHAVMAMGRVNPPMNKIVEYTRLIQGLELVTEDSEARRPAKIQVEDIITR